MAAINDLVAQIKDEALRWQIEAELKRVMKHKKFGLVFEDHLPEGLNNGPIYPGLEVVDSVRHAKNDQLWHALIQADNYYALQLLAYLYPASVDCIYIDPPYNSGAKDWKYNNDYVDTSDTYRHSKWLSMMKRRLLLAKRLLNPKDSVLIVTIDEKEYLHLGCLLEELFPEARMQMVTSVISAKGVVRVGQFSRVEEYIFIIELGDSKLVPVEYNMLDSELKKESNREIEWLGFRRRAPQAIRTSRPNQFYPIFVDTKSGQIHSIGAVLPHGVNRHTIEIPEGCVALWPLSKNGDERLWSLQQKQALINLEKGYLKVNWDKKKSIGTVYYLTEGTIKDIEYGIATTLGYDKDGSIKAMYYAIGTTPPKRVWNKGSHNAETYGSNIISAMFGKRFDFPKSLYAVHDTIRFYVANKPNALIVDFFAGSGTTLHAVNLLNAEDGGHRRCIMVTNNEVSAEEAKALTKQGYKQGDEEWEKLGIARYVNWPRTVCSIEGHDVNGQPLKGEYLGTNHMQMSEGFDANCIFFRLKFLDKDNVALGKQFRELLPLLWMKSDAIGVCPSLAGEMVPDMLILPENEFAVLNNAKAFVEFMQQVRENETIRDIYLIVNSASMYREMSKVLTTAMPSRHLHMCQLYRDYLDNFRINIPR